MKVGKAVLAGIAGGFVGNGVLGVAFSSPLIQSILYDPDLQSPVFIEVTQLRNLPVSVVGLVLLSGIHGWLFSLFRPSIPGSSWWRKGLFWGFVIWAMYWLFQEWFVYHTLLQELILLCLMELAILLAGLLVEGLVIGLFYRRDT